MFPMSHNAERKPLSLSALSLCHSVNEVQLMRQCTGAGNEEKRKEALERKLARLFFC
jgi:hypothetical protein